jgi:hypothetical protein
MGNIGAQAAPFDPTGGLGGGGGGGGGGAQAAPSDPSGLGLGGDTSGMGGMNPAMGFGDTFATLSDPGAAGVQQQMAARGFSQGQQPLTDQPGAQAQQPQQGAQQATQQAAPQQHMTAEQLAQTIFHGPAGPSGTPGADPFSERFGATESPANFAERLGASDPSNIYNNAGSPGLTPDQFNARFAGNQPPSPTTGAAVSQRAYPGGGLPKLPPDPGPAPMDRSSEFPNIDPSQNPSLSQPGTTYNPATDPSLSGATPPVEKFPGIRDVPPATTTPQVTTPGTPAPAGMAPQSPLEQLVSGFLHMLLGGGQGGLGPLEQLIGSMLGLNPRQMFPGFYGGGFNPPPGPGYFPPGTVGGRQIGAGTGSGSSGPPGPQSPQVPPRQMPGTPTPPQAPQPRAPLPTPDPRRWLPTGSTERLPGPPYTARRAGQPPPWYREERNPARAAGVRAGGAQPARGGTAEYVSQNSIAASRIAGSNTRPTPGYSTTMRDARARAFQGMDDQTKRLVAGMANAEHSSDPIGPIEALLNRSAQTGTPVRTLLYNGFYRNTAPSFMSRAAQLESSGQMGRYMAAIDAVGNGSNVLAGATDQGSAALHDPNALNPSGRIIRFDETYNDHTPASARWRQQIQQRVQQELQAAQ